MLVMTRKQIKIYLLQKIFYQLHLLTLFFFSTNRLIFYRFFSIENFLFCLLFFISPSARSSRSLRNASRISFHIYLVKSWSTFFLRKLQFFLLFHRTYIYIYTRVWAMLSIYLFKNNRCFVFFLPFCKRFNFIISSHSYVSWII